MGAAYAGSLGGAFVLDDRTAITENPSILDLRRLGEVLRPPAGATTCGRPLLNLSFALNHALGGLSPGGYHAANLLIHGLAALALFGLVRRTLLLPVLRPRFGPASTAVAFTAALLWALHPLQTEAVTYVSQRAESLMGLLYLLTLYGSARSLSGGRGWAAVSVACCLLGTGVKEVIVTAPLVVLLHESAFTGRTPLGALRGRPWYYAALGSTWAVLAAFMASSHLGSKGVGYGWDTGPVGYALVEGRVVLDYLRLAAWPHPLVFDYGAERFAGPAGVAGPAAALAVLGLAAAAAWGWRRGRAPLGFAVLAFLVVLAPTSSVVPITTQPMAESRMYLPLAAAAGLAALGGYALAGRRALVLLWTVAAVLGVMTAVRNRDYASPERLWRDTLAKNPVTVRGWYNLGCVLGADPARAGEAEQAYTRALAIGPRSADAHNNLGALLAGMPGRRGEALAELRTALALRPDSPETHNNLGNVLADDPAGRAEAAAQFAEALRLRPGYAEAHSNLGSLLGGDPGRRAEALAHLREALRLRPDYAKGHNNLALVLASDPASRPEAITEAQEAVRLDPALAEARYNLAVLLAGEPGCGREAAAQYRELLRLTPDDAQAREALRRLEAEGW